MTLVLRHLRSIIQAGLELVGFAQLAGKGQQLDLILVGLLDTLLNLGLAFKGGIALELGGDQILISQ
ncbi:hypothetical protein D3C76_1535250 [compost metagenome]